MAPFTTRDELDALVAGLVESGLVGVGEADGSLTIIASGRTEHTQLLQRQQVVRDRAFAEYGQLWTRAGTLSSVS